MPASRAKAPRRNLLIAAVCVLDPPPWASQALYEFAVEPGRAVESSHHAMHLVRQRLAEIRQSRRQEEEGREAALQISLALGAPEPWSTEATGEHWGRRLVVSTAFPSREDGRTPVLVPVKEQPHQRLREGRVFTPAHHAKWVNALRNDPEATGADPAIARAVESALVKYAERVPAGVPVRVRIPEVRKILGRIAKDLAEVAGLLNASGSWQEFLDAQFAHQKLTCWGFPAPQMDELPQGSLIPASDVPGILSKLPRLAAGARLALADPDLTMPAHSQTGPVPDTEAFDELVCALADVFLSETLSVPTASGDGKKLRDSQFIRFVKEVLKSAGEVLPEYPLLNVAPSTLVKKVQAILSGYREHRLLLE